MDWFCWENLNRKPMGFYHQIDRGFRCKFSHHPILWYNSRGLAFTTHKQMVMTWGWCPTPKLCQGHHAASSKMSGFGISSNCGTGFGTGSLDHPKEKHGKHINMWGSSINGRVYTPKWMLYNLKWKILWKRMIWRYSTHISGNLRV